MTEVIEEKGLLIPLPATALEVFKPGGVDPILSAIEAEVKRHTPDLTTAKGRSEIASLAFKVAKSKTYLDGLGKTLVAEWKQKASVVDAERKKVRDTLDALKEEARKPLTKWEEEEEARIAKIRNAIQFFHDTAAARYEGSAAVDHALRSVKMIEINETFGELTGEATMAKDYAVKVLTDLLEKQIQHEADQAELARLRQAEEDRKAMEAEDARLREEQERKAREEKERAEREDRIRRDAEEKAKREVEEREARLLAEKEAAERREKEASDRAKVEAEQAEIRAKRQAEEAARQERERIERKQREEEAEQRRRDENTRIRNNVKKKAVAAMCETSGLFDDAVVKIFDAIAAGKIPNVSVRY